MTDQVLNYPVFYSMNYQELSGMNCNPRSAWAAPEYQVCPPLVASDIHAHPQFHRTNSLKMEHVDSPRLLLNDQNKLEDLDHQNESLEKTSQKLKSVEDHNSLTIEECDCIRKESIECDGELSMSVDIYNPFSVYFTRKKLKVNSEDESAQSIYGMNTSSANYLNINNHDWSGMMAEDSFEDRENRAWLLEKKVSYQGRGREIEAKREAERKSVMQELLKSKRKILPIRIQKKAAFLPRVYLRINEAENFLLLGDYCVCKDTFSEFDSAGVKSMLCPMNYFRPPVEIIKGINSCLAKLDSSYHGRSDVNFAAEMLLNMQSQEAKNIADYLNNSHIITLKRQTEFREKVLKHYSNSQESIVAIVEKFHESSMKKAFEIIEKLDQNQFIALHYKKLDPFTLMHKQHLLGGNSAFCGLFMGSKNVELMRQFMSRWGLPHYMDSKGILDQKRMTLAGENSFSLNMITYDDFDIPLTATIERVNLDTFEIIPGVILGDFLEIRVLQGNPKLLENIERKRQLNPEALYGRFEFDDIQYTQNAQQFIGKYYADATIPNNIALSSTSLPQNNNTI